MIYPETYIKYLYLILSWVFIRLSSLCSKLKVKCIFGIADEIINYLNLY